MSSTNYQKATPVILEQFQQILGRDFVLTEPSDLEPYSHDETEDLHFYPQVVLKPQTTEQVSQIMKICDANNIPVTPRGGGTGLSGGALPIHGGGILSPEKMNKILENDPKNMMARVEAGV